MSEPDDTLPVGTVVGEELALAGLPAGARAVSAWLAGHGVPSRHVIFGELAPLTRTRVLAELAAARPHVHHLVLTLPERHGGATERIRSTLTAKVSAQAATTLLVGFGTIASNLDSATTGATKLADGASSDSSGARPLAAGAATLADGTTALASGAARPSSSVAALPAQTQRLAEGAATTATGASSIASGSASRRRSPAAATRWHRGSRR